MSATEDFEARAQEMAAKARARGDVDEPESKPQGKAEIIQFPFWPEPERGVPNVLIRSALFAVVKKGARRYFEQERLASWPGTELAFTGKQLDTYDEDVWMELVHLHRVQGVEPGKPLHVNAKARGFMRSFGRARGSKSAESFYASVTRMEACAVHLSVKVGNEEVEYIGSLVQEAARVKGSERWGVVLNPKLLPYFLPGQYSRIDLETRRALRSSLSKKLHEYIVSHRATEKHPHRIGLERLRELSGSTTVLKDFRYKLKKAMAELKSANVVASWRITPGDALEFVR